MTKILVVGGTGTVGREAIKSLTEKGAHVKLATRAPEKQTPARLVEPVLLDLQRPETFGPALSGADRVFLMSPGGHADAHALLAPFVQVAGGSVSKILTMSAQGVEQSDDIPLRRLELAVEAQDVRFVHLRPTWFSQNFNSYWLQPILEHGLISLPAADSRTAFIDARDIGESAAAALVKDDFDGQAIELTGPEAMTYAQAAQTLSEVSAKQIRYQHSDDASFRQGLLHAGLPEDYADFLVVLFEGVRAGAAATVTDSVERLTGHPPRTLRAYASDYRNDFV